MKKILLVVLFLFLVSCNNPSPTKSYAVVFVANEEIILTTTVSAGNTVEAPIPPEIDGFIFSHWDTELTNVQSDLVINAIYEELFYQVTFMVDEEVITTVKVKPGQTVTPPSNPRKDGYNFIGWDQNLTNIKEDLIVKALFKKIEYFEVKFIDGETILSTQSVAQGLSATAPVPPVKEGYIFTGWSADYHNVLENLTIYPVYEKITIPPVSYTSYIDTFTYNEIKSPKNLINQAINNSNLKATIDDIHHGGFRNTNYIVYYNASNLVNRNTFGFEIAVNADGVVINKSTLVTLPQGGFIISAHGTGIDKIEKIDLGDIIKYDINTKTIKVYKAKFIGLYVKMVDLVPRIEEAMAKFLALDYQGIETKFNEAISLYNQIVDNYNSTLVTKCDGLLLEVEFMLVEGRAVQTKAFWHYPTKNSGYSESNLQEVEALLDKIKEMGFNNIYLNTNMDGRAIYKSEYLEQKMTAYNKYGTYKDYLECFISEAHKRGLKVTAWTNTLIAGDGSLNYKYQNWLQKGFNGENNQGGMYFIDISNPDARAFLLNVFNELASNYALDGIEFDFIRFPSGNLASKEGVITDQSNVVDWGYTDSFINGFKEKYPFTGDFKTQILTNVTLRTNWINYKCTTLNNLVKDLVTTIRNARPTIIMSAAVMSNLSSAKATYLQDWLTWVEEGWMDVLDPMIYNADNEYVLGQVQKMMEQVKGKAQIVAGLYPETNGGLVSANAQQIALITDVYQIGWAKFSSKVIFGDPLLMQAFSAMKREYTVTEQATREEIYHAYLYDLLEKASNYYQYADNDTDYQNLITLLVEAFPNLNPSLQEINETITKIENELIKISNITIKNKLWQLHNNVKAFLS